MRFERIISTEHPMYAEAMKLYKASFPFHEQREAPSQKAILADNAYHFALIYDEDTFVGEILYWETDSFIYIEHFCILPEMRNRQYGQKTLDLISQMKKTVILEIDPPIDCIAKRRKGFYERCGFAENKFDYVQLPYHKGDNGHPLVIMSSPRRITDEEYRIFYDYLSTHVMKDIF